MSKAITKPEQQEITETAAAATAAPPSARFQADVERQFEAELGRGRKFTALEQRLTQHMFLKVDQALKASEADRVKKNKQVTPFNWTTINRQKLALDTVHIVSLGLDPLIPNHVWPVTYWNSASKTYTVDLRVGYIGRDFIARKHAMDPPLAVHYELVHETDEFRALPKSSSREVEGYEFEIHQPFDRGAIVGGFGYLVYDDPRKNKLLLVTQRDFERSSTAAQTKDFWNKNDVEMHLKTVVHRVASKIPLDPEKVNSAVFAAVLNEDRATDIEAFEAEARQNSHQQLADIEDEPDTIDTDTVEAEPVEAGASDGSLFPEQAAPAASRQVPF